MLNTRPSASTAFHSIFAPASRCRGLDTGTLRRCPQRVKKCARGHPRSRSRVSCRIVETLECCRSRKAPFTSMSAFNEIDDGLGSFAHRRIFESGRSAPVLLTSLIKILQRPLSPNSDFRDEFSERPLTKPPLATKRLKGRISAFVGQLRLSVHGTAPAPMRAMGSFDDCQEHAVKRSISPRKRCIFLACVILLAKHSCRPTNAETWSR